MIKGGDQLISVERRIAEQQQDVLGWRVQLPPTDLPHVGQVGCGRCDERIPGASGILVTDQNDRELSPRARERNRVRQLGVGSDGDDGSRASAHRRLDDVAWLGVQPIANDLELHEELLGAGAEPLFNFLRPLCIALRQQQDVGGQLDVARLAARCKDGDERNQSEVPTTHPTSSRANASAS
ncbi:MAG: hypothetical protein D6724_10520, partial [Armatimonadetes bacterium]